MRFVNWCDSERRRLIRLRGCSRLSATTSAVDLGRSTRRRLNREAATARPERWFAEAEVDGLDAEAAVAALESLPAEQREAIVGRLWGGMTLEQLADVAGCSITTAHRRFEAGIQSLRERLGVTCPK